MAREAVAGTVIVSTGAVVGGYYVAGAGTALAGGNGWAAASSGLGAINTISLANNAASLTIDPTLREGFDTTADLVNMGMTVGGKLLNGRTKYAATILDIGINGAQSAIGVNDAVTSYEAGHEKWAYFQATMAGLGFAGSGLRFHQEFEVSVPRNTFYTTPFPEIRPRSTQQVPVSGASKQSWPRISAVAPDWATKGAHIHVNGVELAVRPGNNASIVFKPVFSSTKRAELLKASNIAEEAIQDIAFRQRLHNAAIRAMLSIEGETGKAAELRFLIAALQKMGV